jgi:hypothetical protein
MLGLGPLALPNHQTFAGGFHNCFSHLFLGVDFENPLDLGEKSVQQPKVSSCNPNDGSRCVRVQRMLGKLHVGRRPMLVQQLANLFGTERPKLMNEADAGVELRVASQEFFTLRGAGGRDAHASH